MLKLIAIGLCLIGTSLARAETVCWNGEALDEHPDYNGRCPAREEQGPPMPDRQDELPDDQEECKERASNLAAEFQSCTSSEADSAHICDWDNSLFNKQLKKQGAEIENDLKDVAASSFRAACTKMTDFNQRLESGVGNYKNNCQSAVKKCVETCGPFNEKVEEITSQLACSPKTLQDLASLKRDSENAERSCRDTLPAKMAAADRSLAASKEQSAQAKKCVLLTDSGGKQVATLDQPIAPTQKEAMAAIAPGAGGGSPGGGGAGGGGGSGGGGGGGGHSGGGGSGSGGGNYESASNSANTQKKQTNNNNSNNPMNALMGMASGLMGMMNQKAATSATPTAPAELAADDCRRPDRANSTICFCSIPANARSQRCLGTETSNYASMGGNALQGVGGAKLASGTTATNQLNLPSSVGDIPYTGAGKNGDDGGGRGMAAPGYGGGGGVNPGHQNQKPDPPAARPKSSLSADILVGVRGGGSPFGGPRGPSAPRGGSYGSPRDPDDLPGYALRNRPQDPNLRNFLPPSRETAAVGAGQVAGAAAFGSAIHSADKNIFNEMTNRYRLLEDTLLP